MRGSALKIAPQLLHSEFIGLCEKDGLIKIQFMLKPRVPENILKVMELKNVFQSTRLDIELGYARFNYSKGRVEHCPSCAACRWVFLSFILSGAY